MKVSLVWATPKAGKLIGWMARVSNPKAKPEDSAEKLIGYMIENKHWSPFEMAGACVKVETTRDIARQLLRHRSLHFQEFSQRYAAVDQSGPDERLARLQDTKNRQNSIFTDDPAIQDAWSFWKNRVWDVCWAAYQACLALGIAKEVARALLPEGLTKSYLYVFGTYRDWIHYLSVRLGNGTQREHIEMAQAILANLEPIAPEIFKAAKEAKLFPS